MSKNKSRKWVVHYGKGCLDNTELGSLRALMAERIRLLPEEKKKNLDINGAGIQAFTAGRSKIVIITKVLRSAKTTELQDCLS